MADTATMPPMPPNWTAWALRLSLGAVVGLAFHQYSQINQSISHTAQTLESVAKIVAQHTVLIEVNTHQIALLDRRIYTLKGDQQ